MPKVIIVRQPSGSRDGADWPAAGEVLEVPKEEASDLVRLGIARFEKDPEPEKAVARKPETATRKGGLTKESTGL